ncbi:MAG: FtsX-like permease family protein, partial [Aliifodinibius sp.]|nr:FtsX-like permease family protein [Fodinibius sp.]
LLHTFLSILGIVIGVAALVTILSLIDGMENYARSQITETTSLRTIIIENKKRQNIDGVWVDNNDYPVLTSRHLEDLESKLNNISSIDCRTTGSAMITALGDTLSTATYFYATSADSLNTVRINMISGTHTFEHVSSAIVSKTLAEVLKGQSSQSVLGKKVSMHGREYSITGIFEGEKESRRRIVVPLSSLSDTIIQNNAPKLVIEAEKVEEVEHIKEDVESWLATNFEDVKQHFNIITNKMRVEQARKGLVMFKLIMGLITGIAVVVGGIGIMNVLLISVTERTTEIGVRKAAGAKRFDIMLQFLSESVTVSMFGSFVGLILGILVAKATVPIVKIIVDVPFEAGFSISTLGIIAILAVLIGIVFGTYPAMRAAKLTPVEAIRRE